MARPALSAMVPLRTSQISTSQLADGSVTWPKIGGQMYARVSRSTTFSLTSGAGAMIPFDTVDTDVSSIFSLANPTRLTVPADGFYLVGGFAEFASAANGLRQLQCPPSAGAVVAWLHVPGGDWNGTTWVATTRRLSICGARVFTAGQFVELQGFQDSGGALNVSAGAVFWMARVG